MIFEGIVFHTRINFITEDTAYQNGSLRRFLGFHNLVYCAVSRISYVFDIGVGNFRFAWSDFDGIKNIAAYMLYKVFDSAGAF